MPSCTLECPGCGTPVKVKLVDEVTPVQGPCGYVFLALRPDVDADALQKKEKTKKPALPPAPPPPPLSVGLLEAADDNASNAVIKALAKKAAFQTFAKAEMDAIVSRDAEDDEKLAQGIALAVSKGAIPPKKELPLERTSKIDVLGLSADQVAGAIVAALGDAPSKGCVVVLQGLSGTGKGTTVAKLQAMLPKTTCWSNGNIFRSLTLLAVRYFESHGLTLTSDALSPSLLKHLVGMLHFEEVTPKGARVTATTY